MSKPGTLTVQCQGKISRTKYIDFDRLRPVLRRLRPRQRRRRSNPANFARRQLKQNSAIVSIRVFNYDNSYNNNITNQI